MAQICCNSGGMYNVIKVKFCDSRIQLQQHGQGLADTWKRKNKKCLVVQDAFNWNGHFKMALKFLIKQLSS